MYKFYFPMETMRITQNPYGDASHHKHNLGVPKDYPIDSAGVDGGQSACFAPVDMRVTAIKGIGNSATNTIWLQTVDKVKTPTFIDHVFMAITHFNDKDKPKKYKVGGIIKKGEIICYEGKDGASGNHLHIVVGKGTSNDWVRNTLGAWVIKGEGECLPPEDVMFVYDKFTRIIDTGGINFEITDSIIYNDVLGDRGYLKHGDSGENIKIIADFLANNVKGNYFGDYMEACVKVFQKQNNLKQDGCIGEITLAKMREKGLNI